MKPLEKSLESYIRSFGFEDTPHIDDVRNSFYAGAMAAMQAMVTGGKETFEALKAELTEWKDKVDVRNR